MSRKRAKRTRGKDKKVLKTLLTDAVDHDVVKWPAECVAVGFLMVLGLIYSVHFFEHFVFPNSDFSAFLDTGQKWLQFQIPGSMKRAPLFSIITALMNKAFPGPGYYSLGTELYNAAMLPVAMVLIYLVGRDFLGRAAVWVALLAGITPWMVRMSSQQLAELTLIVLFAATALCARSHINLAYLFAMSGSIARWDLAALIPAVAVVDLLRNRKWLKTIILSVLASIPFALCMLITKIQLQGHTGGAHYLQVLANDWTFELFADLHLYWRNICSFLNAPTLYSLPSGQVKSFESLNSAIAWSTGTLLAAAFLAGSVTAIIRKRWEIIVMLLAGVPYVIVHALYPYRMSRFCVPVMWIGLMVAAYGLIVFWQWFSSKAKPKFLIPALQLVGAVIFVLWAIKIAETLTYAKRQCPVVGRLVIISSVFVVAGFFVMQFVRRRRPSMGWLITPAFLVLAVFSNITTTGFLMGDGQKEVNFKYLSLWFLENAGPDDRMATTMKVFMPIYTGLPLERFVHTGNIDPEGAKDFPAFVRECRKLNVTLIAWDSRLAGRVNDRYYKLWGLDRIKILAAPLLGRKVTNIGPCKLVHVIDRGSPKIAVYRIMPMRVDTE